MAHFFDFCFIPVCQSVFNTNMHDFELIFDNKKFTSTIYSLVIEKCYEEVITILESVPEKFNSKRPGLSLLAYCYYQIKDYKKSSTFYEKLTNFYPNDLFYKLSFAQTLYQIGQYDTALDLLNQLENTEIDQNKILDLKIAIKYNSEKYTEAKQMIQVYKNNEDSKYLKNQNNLACIFYKEEMYEKALTIYQNLREKSEKFQPQVTYNIALCYYQLQEYHLSLETLSEIIEYGIKNYPELNIGLQTEGIEVSSVGNCSVLAQGALAEAFNLKAAIYYKLNQINDAIEALTDMPPRAEHELDAVTLHNQALILNSENDIEVTFEKFSFLLKQDNGLLEPTFSNLILMCFKYEKFEYANEILNNYSQYVYKYLTPILYEFIEIVIMQQTNDNETIDKLEDLLIYHYEYIRKTSKEILNYQKDSVNKNLTKLNRKLNIYITDNFLPTLMTQANLFWNQNEYETVEKILKKSTEICSHLTIWKLNYAHVLFIQGKFQEALSFYVSFIDGFSEQILTVNPVVLANLCVCYIMLSQNTEASELIKKISAEENILYTKSDKFPLHLTIVNLIIGTLYCSKNNYEFGISRIILSMEPFEKKLATDTWYYTKRCFLSLFENMSKQLVHLNDTLLKDCLSFLENCELYGTSIMIDLFVQENDTLNLDNDFIDSKPRTISHEARLLKCQLLKLI